MNIRGQTMRSCPPCECAGIHEARGCAGVGCGAGVCGEERAGAGALHFSWGRDGGGWSLVWKVIDQFSKIIRGESNGPSRGFSLKGY